MALLIGRASELATLTELTSRLEHGAGGALTIRGPAGIGKSALLAAVVRATAAQGAQVLSATGVQAEARIPFAGLHQLLRPIMHRIGALPPRQRTALQAAFGMS